jgi:RimJ/RimL family protein N-acetyltransferase
MPGIRFNKAMQSERIKLLAHTPAHLQALLEGGDVYETAFGIAPAKGVSGPLTGPDVSELFRARLRDNEAPDPGRDGFGIVHLKEKRLIGLCSYWGPPDSEGVVEIAYFIAPDFEGQGYATEATKLLVADASASGQIRRLRAHTLAEENASTRVLKKCGFEYSTELFDSVDGRIWRWEKEIPPNDCE